MQYQVNFDTGTVQYIFDSALANITGFAPAGQCIIITDSNIAALYPELVQNYKSIVIPAGEDYKNTDTLNTIIEELLTMQAHRQSFLVGVGGGVITDITGFAASVYMRGTRFGFVPTTLLAMVDASIGGKNGINYGLQKNLLGTIQQPEFILYDHSFLETLPIIEWSNGFAEIIKYACIFDAALFKTLEKNNLDYYKSKKSALQQLLATCIDWKNKTVTADEQEKNIRKLLNFGHTTGHAIETLYHISHGQAVALGMLVACLVSETIVSLDRNAYSQLAMLLQQYKLPASLSLHTEQLMGILLMDKKRNDKSIDFVVLERIGNAAIKTISFDTIKEAIDKFSHAGHH